MATKKRKRRVQAFVPRAVKARGAKAVRAYKKNPRKLTVYNGFRTQSGRTAKGRSIYRFDKGFKGIKGSWEYVKSYRRHRTGHTAIMKQRGGTKKIHVEISQVLGKKDRAYAIMKA